MLTLNCFHYHSPLIVIYISCYITVEKLSNFLKKNPVRTTVEDLWVLEYYHQVEVSVLSKVHLEQKT